MKKIINNKLVDMTSDEITQRKIDIANAQQEKDKIEQDKIDKEQNEQSAINKLKALGLTDAEVEAFRK